jgi:hypothetical protein
MHLKGRTATMIDIEETGGMNLVPCLSYQCRNFYEKLGNFKE